MTTRRRTTALTLLILVVFFAALAYVLLSEKPIQDPRYAGKSLSEWIEIYQHTPGPSPSEPSRTTAERLAAFRANEARIKATRAEVELAVRSIGTNALPYLLDCFRYELPWWRKTLLKGATLPVGGKSLAEGKIVLFRSSIIGPNARKVQQADLGFVILNTNAAPAIPELEAMMKDDQKPERALRAINALSAIGVPAVGVLTNALADTNQIHRCEIMSAFYVVREMSPPSRDAYLGACLPALNQALDDADAKARRQARTSLYNIEHWDEILARLKDVGSFRRARTNSPKPGVEGLTNTPAR